MLGMLFVENDKAHEDEHKCAHDATKMIVRGKSTHIFIIHIFTGSRGFGVLGFWGFGI